MKIDRGRTLNKWNTQGKQSRRETRAEQIHINTLVTRVPPAESGFARRQGAAGLVRRSYSEVVSIYHLAAVGSVRSSPFELRFPFGVLGPIALSRPLGHPNTVGGRSSDHPSAPCHLFQCLLGRAVASASPQLLTLVTWTQDPTQMNILANSDQDGRRPRSWFGLHQPFDPKYRIVTSGCLQPRVLLGVRVSFAMFCIVATIINAIYEKKRGIPPWL